MRSLGKVDRRYFREHISGMLGSKRADVIMPPAYGFDFGLVDLGKGKAMAVSTDPIWIEMAFGVKRAAWFAFHSLVGDVALSGLPPSHLALDWNLPAGMRERQFRDILTVFSSEAERLDMSVVAGHTGVYEGAAFPTIGGGTAFALGRMKDVIRTGGAKVGDVLLITKSPAIEAAVMLCSRYADELKALIGMGAVRRVGRLFDKMTVVQDAAVAAAEQGVTSMHDASERGVAAALNEMSYASRVIIDFDRSRVEVNKDVESICSALKMDPFCSSSQGTLLVTAAPDSADRIVETLAGHGIESFIAGKVRGKGEGVYNVAGRKRKRMGEPRDDHLLRGISAMESRESAAGT